MIPLRYRVDPQLIDTADGLLELLARARGKVRDSKPVWEIGDGSS